MDEDRMLPSPSVWKKLKKNKGAVFGLCVIIFTVIIAALGYLIAPDNSPYANRMILEISGRSPGFTATFLKRKKEKTILKTGFINTILYGADDKYEYISVTSHEIKNDSIVFFQFIDEGVAEKKSLPLSQCAAPPVVRKTFWLGTDKYGRDILSRLILGARISLSVGLVAVLISLSVGLTLGSLAGYFRGKTDDIIMWLINVIWSIPTVLLVFGITLALGKGFWQVFLAIGLTLWVNVARLVRGQILAVRELEYVEAAKALGFSSLRIIVKHIWPNIMGPVMVIAASNFATAILIEAGLSFLGIGVQPPQPSWGLMMKENYNFIITQNPVLALAPGFAIMLLVLAFNLLGNGLRDALSVR
ncbi:MAG: ABC transporter permease [Chitinophagaceae bacterium]|nr:ABC transporter permease [Chitinophagaceae bacterium]